jgi:nucleotide-binding universal stress UspA family protein
MERIIIPLDGSTLSEQALELGRALARASGATLTLAHVVEEPLAHVRVNALVQPEEHEARVYLMRVWETLADDLEVEVVVERGHPADVLLGIAGDAPGTIIVMSTHGRSGVGRIMFGSVADKVMRGAEVPVIVVRTRPERAGLRKLLVPLDGSGLAEAVLPLALDIARDTDAGLHLVRVVEPFWTNPRLAHGGAAAYFTVDQVAEYDQATSSEARAYLGKISEQLTADGVRPSWEVRYGKPAETIAAAAAQLEADLILMSSHGLGGIRRWAFGSVTNEVVQRATTPVLVLPSVTTNIEHEVERILAIA